MNHCLQCGTEVENDDNFCPTCGHWTSKGYSFLKNENNIHILNGKVVKSRDRLSNLFSFMFIFMLLSLGLCFYRGQNILKPFVYIKRQVLNYKYGYDTTIMKNDNNYFNEIINDVDSAKKFIKDDYISQRWQCKTNYNIDKLQNNLEEDYDIISVNFCDMSYDEALNISNVIKNMYTLFPQIKGYLTNINTTNSILKTDYVAYFQPMYQFVNSTNDIKKYNKVNKTQILLNSYYFLNEENINKPLKDNWYVKDATLTSLIAHEFGHYVIFVALLKEYNVDTVVLEMENNYKLMNEVRNIINSQQFSNKVVTESLRNFNQKYNLNYDMLEFASSISNYAKDKDTKGQFIYDEIIAEAIHDYFLHKNYSNKESLEIVNVIFDILR